MPIYTHNGQEYNIPDDKSAAFEKSFPGASISYMNEGDRYDIPISKRDQFVAQFPSATLFSIDQPAPAQQESVGDMGDTPQFNDEPDLRAVNDRRRQQIERETRKQNAQEGMDMFNADRAAHGVAPVMSMDEMRDKISGSYAQRDAGSVMPAAQPEDDESGVERYWRKLKEGGKRMWGNILYGFGETANAASKRIGGTSAIDKDLASEALSLLESRSAAGQDLYSVDLKTQKEINAMSDEDRKKYEHDLAVQSYLAARGSFAGLENGGADQVRERLKREAEDGTPASSVMEKGAKIAEENTPTEEELQARTFGEKAIDKAADLSMMIGSGLASVGLAAAGQPELASALGSATFGGFAASSAGESMRQAKEAGATDDQAVASGLASGAIMYGIGRLPFNRFTKSVTDAAKVTANKEIAEAIASDKTKEEIQKEVASLLGKMYGKKAAAKEIVGHALASGASFGTMGALESVVPLIYQDPQDFATSPDEKYPLLKRIVGNATQSAMDGLIMGVIMGSVSTGAEFNRRNRAWKEQGFVGWTETNIDPENPNVMVWDAKTKQWKSETLRDTNPKVVEIYGAESGEDMSVSGSPAVPVREAGAGWSPDYIVVEMDGKLVKLTRQQINQDRTGIIMLDKIDPREVKREASRARGEEASTPEDQDNIRQESEYAEQKAAIEEQTTGLISEETQYELDNARAAMDGRRAAVQEDIQSRIGRPFWTRVQIPGEESVEPTEEDIVRVITFADGHEEYIVGQDGNGNYVTVSQDGKTSFINLDGIDAGISGGAISDSRTISLSQYLDEKVQEQDSMAEQERIATEEATNLTALVEAVQQEGKINIGTPENIEMADVVGIDPMPEGGVMINAEGGPRLIGWQQVADSMGLPFQPKSTMEEVRDRLAQESADLAPAEQVETPEAVAGPEAQVPAEAQAAQQQAAVFDDEVANNLQISTEYARTDGDGRVVVDTKRLWEKDPALWVKYNDADPNKVMGSQEFLTEKISGIDKEINKRLEDIKKETLGDMDQDKIDALRKEAFSLQERKQHLSDVLDEYIKAQQQPVVEEPVPAPATEMIEQVNEIKAEEKAEAAEVAKQAADAELPAAPVGRDADASRRIADILSGKDKKNYSDAFINHKAGDPSYPDRYYDEVVRQWDAFKSDIMARRDPLQKRISAIVNKAQEEGARKYREYKESRGETVDEIGLDNYSRDYVSDYIKKDQEYQSLTRQVDALDDLVSPQSKEKFRQNAIGMLYTDFADAPSPEKIQQAEAQDIALSMVGTDRGSAVRRILNEKITDINSRIDAATPEDRQALIEEKAAAIREAIDQIKSEDATVTTRANLGSVLLADGVDDATANYIVDRVNSEDENINGFRFNDKSYIIADKIDSALHAIGVYIHERQHGITERMGYGKVLADLVNNDRELLLHYANELSGADYSEFDSVELADEIISYSMQFAYESAPGKFEENIRRYGLDNEKILNFVKSIDDEQRKDPALSLARRHSLRGVDAQGGLGQDGRNSQEISGRGMGVQGDGTDGSGEERAQGAGQPAEPAAGAVEAETPEERIIREEGVSSVEQAARLDAPGIRFNISTEPSVEKKIREFARSKEGKVLGWTDEKVETIIQETADLMRAIHAAVSGDKYYDEWAKRMPTVKVDWRDGVEKPTVTWARANIEYKYDMSADLLCINNEGLESVLASPTMADLMLAINKTATDGFTSDDYLRLYTTLHDLGFVVPCKGCFDAAMRLKMLPSVAQKFVSLVNKTIDERNQNPEAFDADLRAMAGDNPTVGGLPTSAQNKEMAVRIGVAGDNLTEHINWTQLMSAEGQTKALSDWGGIFRAWQRTGAGRPKDKLMPEPWSGDIVSSTTTIIGKYGEKTPSFRDIQVNQGTGLRRNSHSEFRPLLAIDEIQFMREAFLRGLTVFKYMKELDDVRLFGQLGVKFNISFFPAFVPGAPAAGLDANGDYIAAEESVGGREFEYVGEDGKMHYDGMKGWQEAQKYVNKDVSLSSVVFSIPHLIKALTDVPTKSDPAGRWGSLIPFHASGATRRSLSEQGLGEARAIGVGHGFEEALTDYDKGVTNFEAVQNDRFGEGWTIVEGKKAGQAVDPGHKLEFVNGTHYYNEDLGLHLFPTFYIYDSELKPSMTGKGGKIVVSKAKVAGHPFVIDYNDKVREIGTDTAYQDASDFYINQLRQIGLVPRFDFEVPEEIFLKMCSEINVDPNHPKLGWRGPGNSWTPIDSEAYYSLFCDYGMIDPETGKWAPHNPVGMIDENGNRVFRLPENTIDIIKEGVARYGIRKDRETGRMIEAISEFAKRSVAEGRLTQEDADRIIANAKDEMGDPVKPERPVGTVNEAAGIRWSKRTKEPPKKKIKVYKLMRLGEDKKSLRALFIDSSNVLELKNWYDADSPALGDVKGLPSDTYTGTKTVEVKGEKVKVPYKYASYLVDNTSGEITPIADFVKDHKGDKRFSKIKGIPNPDAINWATENGMRWIQIQEKEDAQRRYEGENRAYYNYGINGAGAVSTYAMRPGHHAGSLPSMRQIGKGSGKNLRDDSFVWVEGYIPADVSYQAEADANPDKDIPTHIPVDGYYLKPTNADLVKSQADKIGWYVAGSFYPNRIIGDNEARLIIDKWNSKHPDAQVEYDWPRESGKVFNAKTMQLEDDISGKVIDELFGEKNAGEAVSPKQDSEYMNAIESGDTKKAQKMVREAAEKAGYTLAAYHGTTAEFNQFRFNPDDIGLHFGDKKTARFRVGRGKGAKVMPVYLKMENTLKFNEDLGAWDGPYIAQYLLENNMISQDEAKEIMLTPNGYQRDLREQTRRMRDWLIAKGYDSLEYPNWYEGNEATSYAILRPQNIKSAETVTYGNDGKAIPLSERFKSGSSDIRFSKAPKTKEDKDYLAAIEAGDMEKVQKMVDSAAEKAFKNSKVRGEDGKLLKVYHGTGSDFNVFERPDYIYDNGLGNGFYFTDDPKAAALYTMPGFSDNAAKIDDTMIDILIDEFGVDSDDAVEAVREGYTDIPHYDEAYDRAVQKIFPNPHVVSAYINIERPFVYDENTELEGWEVSEKMDQDNLDGVIEKGYAKRYQSLFDHIEEDKRPSADFGQYMVRKSSQIKSADPITYDDAGNIIPLSERFNEKTPDIRFSKGESKPVIGIAPNGKPSNLNEKQWKQVRTPEFKKWFGDWENDPANASKVVDENGEPRVVYHGTGWNPMAEKPGKAVFSEDHVGENFDSVDIDWNFFFTASEAAAHGYGRAVPVFLNIRNMEVHDIRERVVENISDELDGHEVLVTAHDAGSEWDSVTKVENPDGVMYTIRAVNTSEADKHFREAIQSWENEHRQEMEDRYNALGQTADEIYGQIEQEMRSLYDQLGFRELFGEDVDYDTMKDRCNYILDETIHSAAKLKNVSTEKLDDLKRQYQLIDTERFNIFHRFGIEGRPEYDQFAHLEKEQLYTRSDIFALDNPNQIKSAEGNNGDFSPENPDIRFSKGRKDERSLVGVHNISGAKLRKAVKAGGLANPSAAVIDIDSQDHTNFGEISLIMPSSLVSASSGRNAGTFLGDAWTPTFPGSKKVMSRSGDKVFREQVDALPSEMSSRVAHAFDEYLEDDRDGDALRWWFLQDTGRNPEIIHHTAPYSEEDARIIRESEGQEIAGENLQVYADLYKKYDPEDFNKKATVRFNPERAKSDFVRRVMEEHNEELDKYGIHLSSVEHFLSVARYDIEKAGRLDEYATMDAARNAVEDNKLQDEFHSWLESKENQFGAETKLFAGWDRNGYKKWVDYTAANASKIMNREPAKNAYGDNGLSATRATLVNRLRTLAEIRANKDKLVSKEEYEKEYDRIESDLASAISELDKMQKITDNPFTNYDYSASRLQEALGAQNPAAYLNREYRYSIPEDGEYAKTLEALKKEIMDMPAKYFETKFNRPVDLSEFAAAVIPSDLDQKTRDILADAGLSVVEYDRNDEGSRRRATLKATNAEGIRFSKSKKDDKRRYGLEDNYDGKWKDGDYVYVGPKVEGQVEKEMLDYIMSNLNDKRFGHGATPWEAIGYVVNYISDMPQEVPNWTMEAAEKFTPEMFLSHDQLKTEKTLRSDSFKRWFGDWENSPKTASKVVDENGRPLPVYHGTREGVFFEFKDAKNGIFFTDSPAIADDYAFFDNDEDDPDAMVHEVYLNMRKPFVIDADYYDWKSLPESYNGLSSGSTTTDGWAKFLKSEYGSKYDGLIVKNVSDGYGRDEISTVYAVFNPKQIKSVDNNGDFDPDNLDIRFSKSVKRDQEYMEAVESGDMKKAERLVDEAARAAGFNSPKLYHGTDAFGFTKIDNNAKGADGHSFWATDKEDVSATYTKYGKRRRVKSDLTWDDMDRYAEDVSQKMDDAVRDFRYLIDSTFSEWFFGQQGNDIIRKAVDEANPMPGYGDGVYDALTDLVADAYGDYGEDFKQYEDFADWQENSPEWEKIETAIVNIEAIRGKLADIDTGDLFGGIYELYANTDNMFVVDAKGQNWNNLHPEGLPKIVKGQYKDIPYKTRDVSDWALQNGYDGVIFKNIVDSGRYGNTPASDVYAFFNPNAQVKSADPVTYDDAGNVVPLSERFNPKDIDIRFSKDNRTNEMFISNAESALDRIKQEKATPEQWLKMLEKEGGLKAGEDKWIGLSDWLRSSNRKTLTRQEVADYIDQNRIRIEEVHYSEFGRMTDEQMTDFYEELPPAVDKFHSGLQEEFYDLMQDLDAGEAYDKMAEKYGEKFEEAYDREESIDNESLQWNYIDPLLELAGFKNEGEENDDRMINPTRLTYTMPGLKNKREIALTVPSIDPYNEHDEVHFGDAGPGRAIAWIRFGEMSYDEQMKASPEDKAELERLNQKVFYLFNKAGSEPSDENREAFLKARDERDAFAGRTHARELTERRRVLFIDEIQSKRHQDAREKGYLDEKAIAKLKNESEAAAKAFDDFVRQMREKYQDIGVSLYSVLSDEEKSQYDALDKHKVASSRRYRFPKMIGLVPAAPFEKNWHELAMKRMLIYAAENNFDEIAWTTGDQQAERYDLSDVVSKIISRPDEHPVSGEKEFDVEIYGNKANAPIYSFIVSKDGVVEAEEEEYDGKKLSDIIGKELANKILSSEDGTVIEGDNLRIGGEGMRGFYDRILPTFMNKYGKKWGVKVEDREIDSDSVYDEVGNPMTFHTVKITPDMKRSVKEGQLMFSKGPAASEVKDNSVFAENNRREEVFFSNAEAAVGRINQEKATPEQWLKMIEKEGGLKAGEDKWIGLSDWLKSLDRKTVTKQEIADYIAENKIQIEEQRYSEGNGLEEQIDRKYPGFSSAFGIDNTYEAGEIWLKDLHKARELYERVTGDNADDLFETDLDDFAMELANEARTDRAINGTRLNYTTRGLDNKREIALVVPTIEPWNQGDDIHFGDAGNGRAIAWVRFGETWTMPDEWIKASDALEELRKKYDNKMFNNPEMTKEDEELRDRSYNVMDNYIIKNSLRNKGNVLVIDEIQSKRHQEGRDIGYANPMSEEEKKARKEEYDKVAKGMTLKYGSGVMGQAEFWDEVNPLDKERILEVREKYREIEKSERGVRPAPFEKNWHELAMKRMLRLAAEEGYDYVAWTTGDQQAERYNLSDKIGNIYINKQPAAADLYMVKTFTPDGNIITGASGMMTTDRINEVFGKDLSSRMMKDADEKNGEDATISGDGLKIGGEGMKGFYDDMLPRFMNKYGKKWGVKVSDITLPGIQGEGHVMHAVPVTPEMRESVLGGQPMFSKGTGSMYSDPAFKEELRKGDIFVSNALQAVESIPMEKATPRQWLKMIEGKGGLKSGEDKWIGLSDWLNRSDKKTLTKQEVADFIARNAIKVEETSYGGPGESPINNTRLQYTTDGLENKREIALTVPTIVRWNDMDDVHFGDAGGGRAVAWIRFGDATISMDDKDVDKAERALGAFSSEMVAKYGMDDTMSKMSEEEIDRLATLVKETENLPRNVLFIDEIQSKRHQAGRENGYIYDENEAERIRWKLFHANKDIERYVPKLAAIYNFNPLSEPGDLIPQLREIAQNGGGNSKEIEEQLAELERLDRNKREAIEEYNSISGRVPAAPFEKNWQELAMKRMLRYAAENGYDYVAWTTGDQQAERYDLSKKINSIYRERAFDTGEVRYDLFPTDGTGSVSMFVKDGLVTRSRFDELAGKRLDEVVGKDIANKMLEMKDHESLDAQSLSVGGDGMKGFYDEMLPRFMNKYGKKWGVNESEKLVTLSDGSLLEAHTVPVNEEMKKSVMKGQLMFSKSRNDAIKSADESGLSGVIGKDEAGRVYRDAMRLVPEDVRREIIDRSMENGLDFGKATREYIGKLAEGGTENDETGLLRVLYDEIRSASGNPELTDADIRYMLWRDAQASSGKDDILALASEEAMKRRFGAGVPSVSFSMGKDFGEKMDTAREKLQGRVSAASDELKEDVKSGEIASILSAMRGQREYDRETVSSIVNYAKDILKGGNVDTMTRTELTKLLTLIGRTTGKSPEYVDKYADQMIDTILDNIVKKEKASLDKLIKIRDKKLDNSGVEVMGRLDKLGQITVAALRGYKDSDLDRIHERLDEVSEMITSPDDAVRENAWAEHTGLELAERYHNEVKLSEEEVDDLKREIREASASEMGRKAYREFIKETTDAIRENKIQRVESMQGIAAALGEGLAKSIESAREFRKAKEQRIEEIHHDANRDLQGTPTTEHRTDGRVDKILNSSFVRLMLSPLATFDQMLRQFGRHSVNGEGYLWNRYMRGWVDSTEKAFLGFEEQTKILDDKVSELFGKKMIWSDLYEIERKIDKEHEKKAGRPHTATFMDGGEMKSHELTSGNLLYIYMVNKMTDGRMKLRKMGITQEDVDRIKAELDPRFIQLADWVQDEYLVSTRNRYNAVHEQLFGAPMAAVQNYFPLKINKMARVESVEPGGSNYGDNALPSTTTGAIIKRRTNSLALDVTKADAFSVVIEHLQQMEDWAAFAPLREDMKSLLSYKSFRNKVLNMKTVYGSGETLWNNFRNVVDLASGVYKPKINRDSVDAVAVNVAKGVTGAKIAFRVQTALKQMLSAPAFLSDAKISDLAKNLFKPVSSWNWCYENLPVFRKRWKSRIAGDTRLEKTDSDWESWSNAVVENLSRWGMTPNAFVDAMTVAVGAKSMYESKLRKYKELGLSDESAERKAKQDATILYNQTQQSNEGAFVSAMQKDRTFLSTTLSTFRNSSMGYTRQTVDALRNYARMGSSSKTSLVEFATRQRMNEGADEEKARSTSEKEYNRERTRNAARIGIFAFLLPMLWNFGVGPLLYLVFGNNKKRKEKIVKDSMLHTLAGPIEGLAGGNIVSTAWSIASSGGKFSNSSSLGSLPAISDAKTVLQTSQSDPTRALNQIVELVVQTKFGVNPQTVTDVVEAILDASKGDLGTAKEIALLMMRITQFPQSAIEDFYFDEIEMSAKQAMGATPEELAQRYAEYKVRRNAPLTGWSYSEEQREKKVKNQMKTINKKLKERKETE